MLTSFGMDASVDRRYVLRQLCVVFVAHNISPVQLEREIVSVEAAVHLAVVRHLYRVPVFVIQ